MKGCWKLGHYSTVTKNVGHQSIIGGLRLAAIMDITGGSTYYIVETINLKITARSNGHMAVIEIFSTGVIAMQALPSR